MDVSVYGSLSLYVAQVVPYLHQVPAGIGSGPSLALKMDQMVEKE